MDIFWFQFDPGSVSDTIQFEISTSIHDFQSNAKIEIENQPNFWDFFGIGRHGAWSWSGGWVGVL